MRRLQSGDQAALDELFTAYADAALRTAYLITRSQATAEDAVQEAFVQVLRSIRDLRDPALFKPWFYRIVVNSARRLARRGMVPLVPLDLAVHDSSDPTAPSPGEVAEGAEELRSLRAAVDELDEAHRLPLVLHYFTGLSEQQIATVLALPRGTVKSRLHKARQVLKKRLMGDRLLRLQLITGQGG